MHISRGVFDLEMAVRKLSSRFRRPTRISRPEWPVIAAVRPLFYLLRFFGLAPFEISEDHFIPGSYAALYSILWILVYTYAAYVSVDPENPDRREGYLIEFIQIAKVIFNYSVAILNVLMAVWARKEFIRVLNIVKDVDSILRDLGYPRKEGVTKIWAWSTGIFTAFVWIIVNRSGMSAFSESWVYNIAYIFNYLVNSLSTLKFSSAVLLLGQRFRMLNKIAQRSRRSATTNQNHIDIDFKVIQQLHNSLMNAGESLSSQYTWSLLLWLMNLCVHSVSNLNYLVNWLIVTPDWAKNRWPLVLCLFWWLIAFTAQLLLLHIACHFTSSEANGIGSIMVNWNSFAGSRNHRMESSLHHINRRLNFSAAGCFYVNLPLLRSITALLATYLVLLMQYQG